MGTTISDLIQKDFTINVDGVDLSCKPLRISHALIVSKVGDVFQNPSKYSAEEILQSEKDMDLVIGQLVPQLAGKQITINALTDIISQMMSSTQPNDDKYLQDNGVRFDSDPKVQVQSEKVIG
jgi:hypothetical protein